VRVAEPRNSRTSVVPKRGPTGWNDRPDATGSFRANRRSVTPPPPSRKSPTNRRTQASQPRERLRVRVRVPIAVRLSSLRSALRSREDLLRRVGIWSLHLSATAAVLLCLWYVGDLAEHQLRSAPAFAIRTLDVQGNVRLTRADIERLGGIAVGRNIFERGPEEVQARLIAEPWIASAEVRRRLPGSYSIRVIERKAIALLARSELYLVSEQGKPFKQLGPGDPSDLPLITGLESADAEDKQEAEAALQAAVTLLRDYTEIGLARSEALSEIHIEADESISCYLGRDATYVRLGKPPFKNKLRRLREVLAQLASQSARASYVYLDNDRRPDRVTVRLR
jgi:cell division protein FtsQ